ncbi:hypothetical protein E8E11_005634 [Didymella keratinophila]|nr:hypothetical protein E8E11_005634 [Didymella keratinophila]
MEHPAPLSPVKIAPDSLPTTPITPTLPNDPDPTLMSDMELARDNVWNNRRITFLLIEKLYKISQRSPSDLGFEQEGDDLMATQKWADDVLEVAWQITMKAGRLMDNVDYLLPSLEEATEMPKNMGEPIDQSSVDEML